MDRDRLKKEIIKEVEKLGGRMLDLKYDEVVYETELSWLIKFGDIEVWLPKSKCDNDFVDNVISVPEWLVMKEGLEGYEV